MSRIPLSPDDPELGHLTGGRTDVVIATGEDRVTIDPGYVADPGSVPMQVKSLRLPIAVVEAIEAVGHPDGLSGVIREALDDWFARRAGRDPQEEAVHALAVLARHVHAREAA